MSQKSCKSGLLYTIKPYMLISAFCTEAILETYYTKKKYSYFTSKVKPKIKANCETIVYTEVESSRFISFKNHFTS